MTAAMAVSAARGIFALTGESERRPPDRTGCYSHITAIMADQSPMKAYEPTHDDLEDGQTLPGTILISSGRCMRDKSRQHDNGVTKMGRDRCESVSRMHYRDQDEETKDRLG